jgi:flagellin
MAKLSSGYRINKAADDAAGMAISETLRAKIRSSGQAKRNASDAISLIQIAEGSMNEVTNILIRLKELSVQSSSDTIGNRERVYANQEYQQLVREIDRIANITEFNGIKLLSGSEANDGMSELVFHIGSGDGSVPNTDQVKLDIDSLKLNVAEVLGLGDEAEIGPRPEDDVGDFDRASAAEKLNVIDLALYSVASRRATLGAMQNRLSSAINNLGVSIENMETAKSRIKDVDFASETASFTQNEILRGAGASVLSQANMQPEIVLSLLR